MFTATIDRDVLQTGSTLRFISAPAAVGSSGTSRIYAFGDSLSDAGNIYTLSGGIVPDPLVYSEGRFTNGRVWVQDLARDLHLPAVKPSLLGGTDFAYGGAEAGKEPLHSLLPIDLPAQLVAFAIQVPHPSANALYTLSIGSNDVIDAVTAYANDPSSALADVRAAVADETKFVAGLAADGARNFAILNVPDLGKTPAESGDAGVATTLSSDYDAELSASLTALASADHLGIHLLDSFSLIDQAVAHPAQFGLTNVTTPVWTGDYIDPLSGHLNAHGAAQNKYLFFDSLHPTEAGHLALAGLALAALR